MSFILGVSAFYHDSAAALIHDGEIIAAAQEERFSRIKHDARFPEKAIAFCLQYAGISLSDVQAIVFYEKPFLKFERLLETYVAFAPKGFVSFKKAMPVWMKEKLFQKDMLFKALKKLDASFEAIDKLKFSQHHFSHAASAFYASPFERAAVLTLDGVGEWQTSTIAIGMSNKLTIKKDIQFPHSLGLLYSAFTYYLGFKVNSGEYKVMGLAPFGAPKYFDKIITHIVDIKEDGSFYLDQQYFNYCTGLTMTNAAFDALLGAPARQPESQHLTQFHMDVAASIQKVLEYCVLKITQNIASEYGEKNLCLAGGVALNCVANGKIYRQKLFENIWVQPAAGDAGGALGAALAYWHSELDNPRVIDAPSSPKSDQTDKMKGALLGPCYSNENIKSSLLSLGAKFSEHSHQDIIERTAQSLASGKAVGWFVGRVEFGPRALGGRSILADPRCHTMQKKLNVKVKFRESFRPFAPSILKSELHKWFDFSGESPYMLMVADIHKDHQLAMTEQEQALFGIDKLNIPRSHIPAVTHVDYSARLQTVDGIWNPQYHALLKAFEAKTGCPILINTSFNVRGEPIVCSPEDAFNCFMGTDLDVLVCENFILEKADQNPELLIDYKNKYALD